MAGGVDIHHGGDDHQPSQGKTNLIQLFIWGIGHQLWYWPFLPFSGANVCSCWGQWRWGWGQGKSGEHRKPPEKGHIFFQVGEVEEEREDERERQEMKRRNYQLVVERAGKRRRGSTDSVEDQVMTVGGNLDQTWHFSCWGRLSARGRTSCAWFARTGRSASWSSHAGGDDDGLSNNSFILGISAFVKTAKDPWGRIGILAPSAGYFLPFCVFWCW